MIIRTLLIFCVSSLIGLQAQKIEFTEYDLENGLHVILHQDNSNPVVTVSVLYHVGSKNEKPNRTGFAHFFEHLLFEGSENIDRGEFDKYVANAGGRNNANTSQDRTFYYESFPSNQVGLGIWLESERMMHAKVDNKGVETQREVVKEEKRLRIDNQPYMTAFSVEIWKNLFKKHPYRWPVIGSMEDLNAATEQDYIDFYKTYYVPNNATLSIAGDIDIEEVKKLVDTYFAPIPRGTSEINRPNVKEDPIQKEVMATVEDKNAQVPALLMAYRTPNETDKDAYVLQIIGNVLSVGNSSRLQKEIVDKKQQAVFVGSFNYGLEDYGAFMVYGLVNQGVKLSELENSIDEVINDVVQNGISQKELDIQKNKLEKDFISSNQTMIGIAESLANYYVYFGDTNLINTELEKYKAITVEDVKRVAKKYLNKDQRVKLYVEPSQN